MLPAVVSATAACTYSLTGPSLTLDSVRTRRCSQPVIGGSAVLPSVPGDCRRSHRRRGAVLPVLRNRSPLGTAFGRKIAKTFFWRGRSDDFLANFRPLAGKPIFTLPRSLFPQRTSAQRNRLVGMSRRLTQSVPLRILIKEAGSTRPCSRGRLVVARRSPEWVCAIGSCG
jgi:hypothetical protein